MYVLWFLQHAITYHIFGNKVWWIDYLIDTLTAISASHTFFFKSYTLYKITNTTEKHKHTYLNRRGVLPRHAPSSTYAKCLKAHWLVVARWDPRVNINQQEQLIDWLIPWKPTFILSSTSCPPSTTRLPTSLHSLWACSDLVFSVQIVSSSRRHVVQSTPIVRIHLRLRLIMIIFTLFRPSIPTLLS